jgi:hypothetical protein
MYTPKENHFLRDGEASVLNKAFHSPQAMAQLIVMMTEYDGSCRGGGSYKLRTATPEVIRAAMLRSSFISLKMEAASSPETLISIYQNVRPHIPEYKNL